MKKSKSTNLCSILLCILLCYLTYGAINHALTDKLSDYTGHLNFYLSFFTSDSFIDSWKSMPYFMWHLVLYILNQIFLIPLEAATIYSSLIFTILSFYILYWMIIQYCKAKEYILSNEKAAFISFGLSTLQTISVYWIDTDDFSMNPIHNPTQMCVRPFALLCFCLVYDIWNKQDNANYNGTFFNTTKGLKRPYIYLAILLFISTFAKPTFAEMFIPAVAFIMLIEWIKRLIRKDGSGKLYFKHCLNMLYCAIPSLLFILLQIFGYIILGGKTGEEKGFIITKWLEVWSMFTENVTLSILLSTAFPLFILLIDVRFFLKDHLGKLALVSYIVSFFEAALLGEGGERLTHGNFLWPLMSAILLAFTASTLHLLDLENSKKETKLTHILTYIAWFMFCLHVLCGLIFFKNELMF